MPFISRSQIEKEIRKPHDVAYRSQLRQSLGNPGLSAEQRQRIKDQLNGVGKPKDYQANTSPRPGAISFDDKPLSPRKALEKLTRADLLIIARKLSLPTNGRKAQIVDRILSAEQRGGSL